jgi:uncharacterized protein
MPYLIDGHNLIPKIAGLSLQDIDDEIRLIQYLQVFCQQTRKKVDVYFDNAPPGTNRTQKYGMVTAHYIRRGRTADQAIINRLNKIGRAAQTWTVVSSDRQVQAATRAAQARILSAEEFSAVIEDNTASKSAGVELDTEIILSPHEVEEWVQIFKKKNR